MPGDEARDYLGAYVADGVIFGAWRHPRTGKQWRVPALAGRYMPRELCRLRLRVGSVTVERLGDIDDAAAVREGAYCVDGDWTLDGDEFGMSPRHAYFGFWRKLHGEPNLRAWVFVIGGLTPEEVTT